jgi:hypothetical protein
LIIRWIEIGHGKKYNWYSMRVIAHSFPISKTHQGLQVNGQHMGKWLARHLKEVLDHVEQTDGLLIRIITNNTPSSYSISLELQPTLLASAIEYPAFRNPILCMAHIIQLVLGAFMSGLGVKGRTKSCEAQERD